MPEINRIVILGGHGRVARLATEQLQAAGYVVDSLIRDIQQTEDIRRVGGKPFELDLETADVEDLKNFLYDALAVVFAAGAGGGDPERTHAVDYAAATRAIDATEQVGVRRFVLVSYANAATDVERLDADDAFYPYARAKHDADAYLRESDLDYTILGPARLTDRPLTSRIQLISEAGDDWPEDKRVTSRANVAAMIAHVISAGAAVRKTVNFYDGDMPMR
ncbi:MAG TPA: NAD(P)H-binding protein, partial [Salinisphaeraceae bacterium]|nr:NAD(P)H-binding protein [Salinisphaeraceae bacterium]